MSLPNLLTSLALVVLFSAILFFYFNRMFKQLDDKVNTFMDLFHGRLEDIASRALMNSGGGRDQSTQNTINLYDLNEESIQTPHIQADGKIVVSDDSESESDSESDGESSEDGEDEGEGQVQLVNNEEDNNDEDDNEEDDNEAETKQMVEELLLSNVDIEDVEDLQVDPEVKVIKSLEKVEDETVGEISKKGEGEVSEEEEEEDDDSLDDDDSESESEEDEEVNAEKEAEIKKLKAMTTKQLKSLAKERKLKKYKSLTKTKLVELLVSK